VIVISNVYEPLKMRAADILPMLKDRANGVRACFQMLISFYTQSDFNFIGCLVSIKFSHP
jgi:hypothetical protein